jgi:hypothetical protein
VFRATEPIQTQAEKIQQVMTITTATAVHMKEIAEVRMMVTVRTAGIMSYIALMVMVPVMRAAAVHTAEEITHPTAVIPALPITEVMTEDMPIIPAVLIQAVTVIITEVQVQAVTAVITAVPVQAVTAIITEVPVQAVTVIIMEVPIQVVTAVITAVLIQVVTAVITEVPIQAVMVITTEVPIQVVMTVIRITVRGVAIPHTADSIPIYTTAVDMMVTADIRAIPAMVQQAVKWEEPHLQEVRVAQGLRVE